MVKLFFALTHKYDLTRNENLKGLSVFRFWDSGKKHYVYVFAVSKLKEVISVLGKDIEFSEDELNSCISHCPNLKKYVNLKEYKGKGKFEVTAFPKLFIVNTVIGKQDVTEKIPVETVDKVWNLMLEFDLDQWISFEPFTEKICKLFKLNRFFRQTGSYDKQKFFGSRRQGYFPYYYYPVKILEYYGVVEYHKKGMVRRVAEYWEKQTEFDEVIQE
jgi:hypothetical protein